MLTLNVTEIRENPDFLGAVIATINLFKAGINKPRIYL